MLLACRSTPESHVLVSTVLLSTTALLQSTLVKYRCRYSNEQSFWKRSVPGTPGAYWLWMASWKP